MIRLASVQQIAPQAWKNGGGRTRELLAWPRADDWLLRISVADIEADGPFSAFDGIVRHFAVLEGGGVELRFSQRRCTLRAGDPMLRFEGAPAPDCRLLDGPTRDLNVMHRQGTPVQVRPASVPLSAPAWRALFTREALTLQPGDEAPVALPAMSLAWSEEACDEWRLPACGDARAWWITLGP